jgi:hypothetical protein
VPGRISAGVDGLVSCGANESKPNIECSPHGIIGARTNAEEAAAVIDNRGTDVLSYDEFRATFVITLAHSKKAPISPPKTAG